MKVEEGLRRRRLEERIRTAEGGRREEEQTKAEAELCRRLEERGGTGDGRCREAEQKTAEGEKQRRRKWRNSDAEQGKPRTSKKSQQYALELVYYHFLVYHLYCVLKYQSRMLDISCFIICNCVHHLFDDV